MKGLIIKDNALIEASHKLKEVEQRLILLAILEARKECNTIEQLKGKELLIHADSYADVFGTSKDMAYKALKQAVLGLFEAKWGYKYINQNRNLAVRYERFTQSAEYVENEALIKFKFSDAIIPLLLELEKRFTIYEIDQVAKLSSSYAMRLYEFFMQHLDKKTGKGWFEISLEDLRFRFGVLQNEYKLMSDFKRRILDFSINEINKKTDIQSAYIQKKKGRSIIGFRFEFYKKKGVKKDKKEIENNGVDLFSEFTEGERKAIQERISDYIKALESKGEEVTDFHKENITKKAIEEGWGLDDYKEKQAKIKEKEEQERKERERIEQEQKELEQENKKHQEMILAFEALSEEEQNKILDSVYDNLHALFKQMFNKNRKEAYKNKIFAYEFFKYFDNL